MAKILYEKYDVITGQYLNQAVFFEEGQQPEGYTSVIKGDFIKAFLDEDNQVSYEGATNEEIQSVKLYNAFELEKAKYQQRIIDGQLYYAGISAKFRLAKLTGQITESEHAVKEQACIPIRNEILAGQWISGMNLLVDMGTDIIGQELYDELYSIIYEYIQSSYTTEEVNKMNTNFKI